MNLISQRVQLVEGVLSQEVSGETVLLDLNNECYFGLNEVGTRIWQLLSESAKPAEILNAILLEFEVEEAELESDIEGLINQLIEKGLLEFATD